MSARTIKLAAAGAAVVVGPAIASADDTIPSFEIATEGGLTFSDYSKVSLGKVGGPLTFDNDFGGYGSISIGRAFDAASPYDWRLMGTVTQFMDNDVSYSFPYVSGVGTLGLNTALGFQTLDFDIGRRVKNDMLEARFYGGVRGMHLNMKEGVGMSKLGGGDSVAWNKLGETEFLGAGPRIGVDARYGGTWGIVGGLSGSAIYGRRKSTISFEYQANIGGTDYGPYEYSASRSDNDWLTEITAMAGVSFKPNDRTEIIAGYRAQKLWNVTGDYFGETNDITVHGPFIGLKQKF